jgi:hypothetical protein
MLEYPKVKHIPSDCEGRVRAYYSKFEPGTGGFIHFMLVEFTTKSALPDMTGENTHTFFQRIELSQKENPHTMVGQYVFRYEVLQNVHVVKMTELTNGIVFSARADAEGFKNFMKQAVKDGLARYWNPVSGSEMDFEVSNEDL